MTLAKAYGQDINGDWIPLGADEVGNLLVSMGVGFSSDPEGDPQIIVPWSYSAASGGITDTSEVTLIAAAGAGRSNYLTSMQVCNTSATATEVLIKSGWRVLWRCKVGASMTRAVDIEFQRPLISANNTSLSVVCLTTGTATYIDAQGYQDETIEQIQADITAAVELFDAAGDAIYDQSGVVITLPGSIQDSPLTSTNVTDLLAYDLLGNETDGIAIDFRDGSIVIRDTTTPANNYAGLLANKLTYSSPSTKYIRNSAGVLVGGTTLRTHYDLAGNALGLMTEIASTNLFLRSQEFDNAYWTPSRVLAFGSGSTANAIAAPDGTTTAEKIVESTASGTHRIYSTGVTITAGATYTVSAWAKASERARFQIRLASDGETNIAKASFNLSTGAVTATASLGTGVYISSSIEDWGNGWYRCSVTGTVDPAATTAQVLFNILNDAGTESYVGDGVSGLYIWGAQIEAHTVATSYIPTTSATVTRANDNIFKLLSDVPALGTTGSAIASSRLLMIPGTGSARLWQISGAASTDVVSMYVRHTTGLTRLVVNAGGVTQADLADSASTTIAVGDAFKVAGSWAANDFAYSANGASVGVDVSGSVPGGAIDRLYIGSNLATAHLNQVIKYLVILPRTMSDAELEAASA